MARDNFSRIVLFQRRRVGDFFQSLPAIKNILSEFNDEDRLYIIVDKSIKALQPFFEPNIVLMDLGDFFKEFYDIDLGVNADVNFLNLEKGAVVFDAAVNLNYGLMNSLVLNIIPAGSKFGFIANRKGDGRQKIVYPLKAANYFFNSIRHRNQNRINIADIFCLFSPRFYPTRREIVGKTAFKFDRFNKKKKCDNGIKRIIFAVGASSIKRQWDGDELAELIRLIHADYPDFEIILVGLKEESDYAKRIEGNIDFHILNIVGRTSLSEVIEILKTGDLIVSPDTGLLQIASFIGLKITAIFLGNANIYETGPYMEGSYVISPVIDCYPCFEHLKCEFNYECKKRIKAKDVFNVVKLILSTGGEDPSLMNLEKGFMENRFNLHRMSGNTITFTPTYILSPVSVFKSKLDKTGLASEIFKFEWFRALSGNKINVGHNSIINYLTEYFILDLDIVKLVNDDIMFIKNIAVDALKIRINEISDNFILLLKNLVINYPHLSLLLSYFINEIQFGIDMNDKNYIESSFVDIAGFLENAHITLNKMDSNRV